MLLRKTTWFWKSGLAAISFVLILSISGCSDAPPEENTVSETVIDVQAIQEESEEDADEIISVCIDLYEKAEEENKLADLETIRSIVNRLGENGYSAVDSRNQINMTEPEKVVEFCEKVDAQEEEEGLQYISGDADGDGTETGTGNFTQLRSGGEIVGFEVSLHIPDLNSVTPVRYIMEPEYVSQQELKQENTMQQVEDAKDTESWTVDQSDGTMYFFLDENNGWRLVITDAAAGSRFYVMEKTMDGGSTWECINDDPFSGQLGVAEGLIFYDENFGVAGITGASQSYSRLYVTRDGGRTFEEMKLPMDLVSELPQIAIDCGFTVEDFDYLNMPEKEDDTLTITVTTDAAEKDGIVFQSTDYGATWEYKGLVQIAN